MSSRLRYSVSKLLSLRPLLTALLTFVLITPPVWSGPSQGTDIIETGGERFEIEASPTIPRDTTQAKKGRTEPEPILTPFLEESGAGQGWVAISIDTFPTELCLDGNPVIVNIPRQVLPLIQGRHFLSLFPLKQVYLTYRDETPEGFWQTRMSQDMPLDRFGLISSYEREAVRTGTQWVQVIPDDTIDVLLSHKVVHQTYRRQAMHTAITLFTVAAVIASAMLGSVALISKE